MSLMKSIRVFVSKTLMFVAASNFLLLPLAEAQSKIKNDEAVIRAALRDLGMDKGGKRPTVGEALGKIKSKMPKSVQIYLDSAIRYHSHTQMPTVEATTVKDRFGQENIRLIVKSEGSPAVTIDYIGQKDRFVRVNNTDYSEAEIANVAPALEKAQSRDEIFKKEGKLLAEKLRNSKLKVPSEAYLKKMTYNQYFQLLKKIQIGLELNFEALEYQTAHSKKSGKSVLNENPFIKSFLEFHDAYAGSGDKSTAKSNPPSPVTATLNNDASIMGDATNDSIAAKDQCVYNGFIGKKDKGGARCLPPKNFQIIESARGIVTIDLGGCSGKNTPCNPLLFGTKDGRPFCVDSSKADEQNFATTSTGICREQSNQEFFGRKGTENRQNVTNEQRLKFFASIYPDLKEHTLKDNNGNYRFKDGNVLVDDTKVKDTLSLLMTSYNNTLKDAQAAALGACQKNTNSPKEAKRQCDIAETINQIKVELAAEVESNQPSTPTTLTENLGAPVACDKLTKPEDSEKQCICDIDTNKGKTVAKKDCKAAGGGVPVVLPVCTAGCQLPCKCQSGDATVTDQGQLVQCLKQPACDGKTGNCGNQNEGCLDPGQERDETGKCKTIAKPEDKSGLCHDSNGKFTDNCKAGLGLALYAGIIWAMFNNGKPSNNTPVNNGPVLPPSPNPSVNPSLPPTVRPPEGGASTPVPPSGLAPKVNQ